MKDMTSGTFTATRSYQAAYTDPLVFKKGQELDFESRETEWQGWIWCTDSRGNGRWLPENWITIEGSKCTLKRDYTPVELTVSPGEELTVAFTESEWAWATNQKGESGWVPLDFLERV